MKKNVLIIGDGRIARAVGFYLQASGLDLTVRFDPRARQASQADLLVGSMAGDLGSFPLEAALSYRKPLVDISDMEPAYFLKNRARIERCRITVVPACGFCPGLVNMLVGREKAALGSSIRKIDIMAGSLSPVEEYFPFLWCFEDLVLEHTLSSEQIVGRRRRRFPAFAGYREELIEGIRAESYYTQSGFENMMDGLKLEEFTYRVLRPRGFGVFYRFLRNEGFFSPSAMRQTKAVVEKNVRQNITVGRIEIETSAMKVLWEMRAAAKPQAKLNSMQKITARTPASVACWILRHRAPRGLVFPEELCSDAALYADVLSANRLAGIALTRREVPVC
jgi:saccharopine dehydrogenase-like NADP-dependent oxidoreductase